MKIVSRDVSAEEFKKLLSDKYKMDVENSKIIPAPILITPEIASTLLAVSRPHLEKRITPTATKKYEDAILSGKWKINGETLILGIGDDYVLNGNNRLLAIVHTGIAVGTVVVKNVPEDALDSMDGGKIRSNSDYFFMEKIENSKFLSAAISMLFRFDGSNILHKRPDKIDAMNVLKKNSMIAESIKFCNRKAINNVLSVPLGAFCHFEMSKKNTQEADAFINSLISGANLDVKHPIKILRDKLMQDKKSAAKLDAKHRAILVFRTWNCLRSNKPIGKKTFSFDKNDSIPILV